MASNCYHALALLLNFTLHDDSNTSLCILFLNPLTQSAMASPRIKFALAAVNTSSICLSVIWARRLDAKALPSSDTCKLPVQLQPGQP